jgi:hypothetical protein
LALETLKYQMFRQLERKN